MVDKLDKESMAAEYGFALSFMQSDPELWKLFNQAVKQTWDPNRFVAKLRGTKWFKTHSANVRNAIMQKTSDPATYKAAVDQMYATTRDAWGGMFGAEGIDDKKLKTWAETAHRLGWSQAQLVDRMTSGKKLKRMLKSKNLGGTAAEADMQIRQLVDAYGVDLGADWRARQVKRVIRGDNTLAGVQRSLRDLASREYGAFADRINGGESVADIAEPYRQKVAGLLEMDPNEVDLKNRLIQRALKQRAPNGKPAAMDLHAFEDEVRRDKRWQYTNNAREQMASVTAQLAQSFGELG